MAGSGRGPFPPEGVPGRGRPSPEDLDLLEAALRHWIARSPTAMSRDRWCFVGVAGGTDPPPGLLERLRSVHPRVCELSRSHVASAESPAVPTHRDTGEEGVRFVVRRLRRLSASRAVAEVSYYYSTMSGAWAELWLERRRGRWVVVGTHLLGIA